MDGCSSNAKDNSFSTPSYEKEHFLVFAETEESIPNTGGPWTVRVYSKVHFDMLHRLTPRAVLAWVHVEGDGKTVSQHDRDWYPRPAYRQSFRRFTAVPGTAGAFENNDVHKASGLTLTWRLAFAASGDEITMTTDGDTSPNVPHSVHLRAQGAEVKRRAPQF